MNVRNLAVKTLVQISHEQAFSNLEINKIIKKKKLDPKDQNLFINLVYGTLQNLLSIDFILKRFITRGFNKLKPYILWTLRMAVYEILFLSNIPNYAIVNEAVELAKKFNRRQVGMVNGVLRNIVREKDKLKMEIQNSSNLEVRYSVPSWIINKYKTVYGNNAENILTKVNDPADLYIRVKPENYETVFTQLKELGAQPLKDNQLGENALIIQNPSAFKDGIGNSDLYKNGMITIQDKGAILIGLELCPEPGENVLDICAAPGGKTTLLAELMKGEGVVDAFDIHEHRTKLVQNQANRLQLKNVCTQTRDSSEFDTTLVNKYDRILVDVPCSGLGIIRRKPEIRYNTDENSLIELESIQFKLLDNAFKYLKDGGKLIYSTCTVNPHENSDIVNRLKTQEGERLNIIKEVQTSFLDNSDGFYYAVLEKVK